MCIYMIIVTYFTPIVQPIFDYAMPLEECCPILRKHMEQEIAAITGGCK